MSKHHHPTSLVDDAIADSLVDPSMMFFDGVVWEWDIDSGNVVIHSEDLGVLFCRHGGVSKKAILPATAENIFSDSLNALRDVAIDLYEKDKEIDDVVVMHVKGVSERYKIKATKYTNHQSKQGDNPRVFLGVCNAYFGRAKLAENVLNNLPYPIFVQDKNLRYLYANDELLKNTGLSFPRLAGRTPADFKGSKEDESLLSQLVPHDLAKILTAETTSAKKDVAINNRIYQLEQQRLTGGDNAVYLLSILQDVDQIKSLEREVQQRMAQGKALFDLMPVLIIYFGNDRKVQVVNRKVEILFEKNKDELRGKTLPDVVPDWPLANDVNDKIAKVISTQKAIKGIESAFRKGDTDYWVKIGLFPIFDLDGEVANVLMVVSDISLLYQHKEKLAEQDARARAMMTNSFESMYCIAIEPPMPMSLGIEEKIRWFLKNAYYSDCNQRCAESINKTIEQVIDHRFVDVVGAHSQIVQVIKFAVDHDFKFNNQVFEFIDNGRNVWWEYSIKPNIKEGELSQFWGSSRDITEAKLKSLELQDNEARYRSFIANSHEGIFHGKLRKGLPLTLSSQEMIDGLIENLVITECNDEYLRQHGNTRHEEIVENFYREIEPHDVVNKVISRFVKNNYQLSRLPIQLGREEEGHAWCSITLVGLISNNKLIGCWGTQRDITERYHYLQRLEHQANHDSLTKLPNRQKLYAELEHRLTTVSEDNVLALILLDLDRFKEINDTLGHHIGDLLLKELGPRLQIIVNTMQGMVARLGGDEFAIMLPGVNEKDVKDVALRLFEAVNPAFNLEGFQAEVKASIGIALSPKHASDVSGLMRYADIAMYQAKNEALGVLEYDPSLDSYTPRRLSLMHDLGKAIRENQLVLHYQPKIDVSGKFVRGFEALLRWNHPEHGFLPPGEFITLAESTENIRPLTLWVLDAALAQCKLWRDKRLDIKMAVNLSARNLLDESIVEYISAALAHHGVPADALELEITESAIMIDPKRAADVMRSMGDLGVHLSIDDYGTGYSSLAYLKSLPVDTLKIDYSFVKDMLVEKHDAIIVHSTINLAHNLGLKVVAEGVENAEILHELDVMGCDLAQGYHVARPMPADEVEAWLHESGWSSLAMF